MVCVRFNWKDFSDRQIVTAFKVLKETQTKIQSFKIQAHCKKENQTYCT